MHLRQLTARIVFCVLCFLVLRAVLFIFCLCVLLRALLPELKLMMMIGLTVFPNLWGKFCK